MQIPKILTKTLAALVVVGAAHAAHAENHVITACDVQTNVYTGAVLIRPCGGWTSIAGNANGWLTFDGTRPGGALTLANLKSARAQGHDVMVAVSPNNTSSNYDTVTAVRDLAN